MPCYQPTEAQMEYSRGLDEGRQSSGANYPSARAAALSAEVNELRNANNQLEAILCALISELKNRGIDHEVIAQASRSGLVDIMSFWVKHVDEDRARIAATLHKNFSEQEQQVIRELLDKKIKL